MALVDCRRDCGRHGVPWVEVEAKGSEQQEVLSGFEWPVERGVGVEEVCGTGSTEWWKRNDLTFTNFADEAATDYERASLRHNEFQQLHTCTV